MTNEGGANYMYCMYCGLTRLGADEWDAFAQLVEHINSCEQNPHIINAKTDFDAKADAVMWEE